MVSLPVSLLVCVSRSVHVLSVAWSLSPLAWFCVLHVDACSHDCLFSSVLVVL